MHHKLNNRFDCKLFIKAVHSHEAVWDRNSDSYKDHRLREEAWHEIAKETNCGDTRRAKMQWKKLKDSFRNALKRRQYKSHEGRRDHQWKYQKLMEFLLPHMYNHASDTYLGNFNSSLPWDSEPTGEYNSDTEKLSKISLKIKKETLKNPLDSSDDNIEYIGVEEDESSNKKWSEKSDQCNDVEVMDPLDHFFASVCQSTKRLPTAAQLRLKRKIMNMVIEEEELILASIDNTSK